MEDFGSMNTDIPFEVLSRLATKNLVELRSVSKGWKSLIANTSFIKVQSKRREEEPLSGFFVQQRFQWCDNDIKTINYIPVKWGKEAELHKNVFHFLPQDVVLLTSCNGLLCCRSCYPFQNPSIFVSNPLNKEWIELNWAEPDKEISVALAFDPFQDFGGCNAANFKLVRVSQSESKQEELFFTFQIYSSKTRSWRVSKEICWCNSKLYKNNGVYIAGILHWLTDDNQILTFNVKNELAWLISPPLPAMEFNTVPEACIGESQGVLHYIMISEEGFHVWFLEDYFEFNWSLKHAKTLEKVEQEHGKFFCNLQERVKQRVSNDVNPWMDPIAFKDGVLLLRVSNTIYFYDIEKSKMEQICEISKFGTSSMYCPTVLPYSMSFIPLLTKP